MSDSFKSVQKRLKAVGVTFDVVRADGRLERTCVCNVGHPVGHLKEEKLDAESTWVHGCCGGGCCQKFTIMRPRAPRT